MRNLLGFHAEFHPLSVLSVQLTCLGSRGTVTGYEERHQANAGKGEASIGLV
jgi:hypothetical protein